MSRIILFITLTVYLFLASILITAISNTSNIDYTTSSKDYYSNDCKIKLFGFGLWCPENAEHQSFTLLRTLSIEIAWISTILIGLPFIAWVVIGITLFFPTGNAGA
jgi:hypothetical protein